MDVTCLFLYITLQSTRHLSYMEWSQTQEKPPKRVELTPFCKVSICPLEMYVTGDVIAKAGAEVANLKEPVLMTAIQFSEALREDVFRCRGIYNEPRLKEIFIEGLHSSIC